MKMRLFLLATALFISGVSVAGAQNSTEQNLNNPNSSFPPSNQAGAPPNEPDPVSGKSYSTRALPNENLPESSGSASDPAVGDRPADKH